MNSQIVQYEIEFLNIGDADAILIHLFKGITPYLILIDAGNVGDGKVIKEHIKTHYPDKKTNTGVHVIDLAICTHPDKDHKGGFFDLIEDKEIRIRNFCLTDPAQYLFPDFAGHLNQQILRKIYDHPFSPDENLIELIEDKRINLINGIKGQTISPLNLSIVAPTSDYYREILKDMINDYGIKIYEESDTEIYDEASMISVDDARSVIDEDDDPSPFNASSLVILFKPDDNKKYLFAGDANCTSLTQMLKDFPDLKNIDYLKVPHHGSKHNLNTFIIETLAPQKSIICAKGSKKHPSNAIVSWLSKFGNVYSTHKCNSYIRHTEGIDRQGTIAINPLKMKIK